MCTYMSYSNDYNMHCMCTYMSYSNDYNMHVDMNVTRHIFLCE